MSGPYLDATVLSGVPVSGIYSGGSGIVGNALVLDGSSALRLPCHQDNLGESFTIAMWYWQASNDMRMTLYQSEDTWNISYEALPTDLSTFRSYVGEAAAGDVSTGLKEWIHLTHVFSTVDGTTTLTVYTNGVSVLTKSVASSLVFSSAQIRAVHLGSYRGEGRYFKGMIDELSLYDRALSAAEVDDLFQRGVAGESLDVTMQTTSEIDLGGTQRSFLLSADDGYTPGSYQDGWLRDRTDELPIVQQVFDTAGRVNDTAGHEDGPFHALQDTEPKFHVPLAEGGLVQVTEGDFTIEARFRTTEEDRGIIMGNYLNMSLGYLNFEVISDSTLRIVCNKGVTTGFLDWSLSTGKNIRDGEWHHAAGVRSNNTVYLYCDGVQLGSTTDPAGSGSFTLGGDYYFFKGDSRNGSIYTFGGDIENARIWTRALSADEVAGLATNAIPGEGMVAADSMLAEYLGFYSPCNAAYANPKYKIEMVSPLAQMTLGDWTAETWFRTTDTTRGILVGNYIDGNTRGFNLELTDNSNNHVRLYVQNTSSKKIDLYGTAGVNRDGSWHHVAGMRRGSQFYLYYDGQQVGSIADTVGTSTVDDRGLYLARDGRTGTTEFEGDLKNTRLWSRALTGDEVAALATNALPGVDAVALDGLLVDYTYIRPTNTLNTAGYPGSRFLRSYIAGSNKFTIVFKGIPPHKEIGIGALISQLDALKPVAGNDHFAIVADGKEVLKTWVGSGTTDEPAIVAIHLSGRMETTRLLADCSTPDKKNLFWCESATEDFTDHVYDLTRLEALQHIPHAGDALTLVFLGVQNQDGSNAGFGIDQVELKVPSFRGTVVLLGNGCAFLQNGVTAHRGNSGELPENTMPAFESALSLGVDWIETDIFLTQDQQVVICHDKDTARVGDKNLDIATSTYAELLTVDMAADFRRRYNLTIEQCPPLRMPLLADVLRIIMKQNRTRLSLQPKDECVNAAFEVIQQMRAAKWVGFNDGSLTKMRQVKSLNPDVPVFWDRDAQSNIANDISIALAEGFESLVVNKEGLTEEKVDAIRQAGLIAGVWTVNSEDELKHFLSIGVQRIYTDYPARLLQLQN